MSRLIILNLYYCGSWQNIFYLFIGDFNARFNKSYFASDMFIYLMFNLSQLQKKLDISLYSSRGNKVNDQTNDRENNREVESYEANFL